MTWKVTTQEDVVLDEGIYDAFVQKLDKIETKFGERVLWTFVLTDEDASVVGFTSLSPSNKAKAAKWARNILRTKDKNINWGPEELEGARCRVYVEVSEDAEGFERNIVTKVLPSVASSDDYNAQAEEDEDFDDIPI